MEVKVSGVKCANLQLNSGSSRRRSKYSSSVSTCESFRSLTMTLLCVGVRYVRNSSLSIAESLLLIIYNSALCFLTTLFFVCMRESVKVFSVFFYETIVSSLVFSSVFSLVCSIFFS